MADKLTAEQSSSLLTMAEDELTPEQIYERALELVDQYSGGKIKGHELEKVLRSLGQNPTESELMPFTISKEKALELFQRYDKDQDGFISAQELRDGLELCGLKVTDEEVVAEMMKQADLDGDGKLNLNEFAQIMMAPKM